MLISYFIRNLLHFNMWVNQGHFILCNKRFSNRDDMVVTFRPNQRTHSIQLALTESKIEESMMCPQIGKLIGESYDNVKPGKFIRLTMFWYENSVSFNVFSTFEQSALMSA